MKFVSFFQFLMVYKKRDYKSKILKNLKFYDNFDMLLLNKTQPGEGK